VNRARDLFETSIVGGALSATALGHYRYRRRLCSVPEMAIIEVGTYVLFPAFCRIAGDPQRFRAAFLRALRVLWCLAMPASSVPGPRAAGPARPRTRRPGPGR